MDADTKDHGEMVNNMDKAISLIRLVIIKKASGMKENSLNILEN